MKKNPVEYYAHAASQRIVCLEEPFSVMAVNGEGEIKVSTPARKKIAEEWNRTKNNLAIAGSTFFLRCPENRRNRPGVGTDRSDRAKAETADKKLA